jgi:PEP-CTERM/exosortase A-associated glycosyltransferase
MVSLPSDLRREAGRMKVLHILDHSVPAMSGYSTRSCNIVGFQRELGLHPVVVTSPKHPAPGPAREERDGITYYRTTRHRSAESAGPGPETSGYVSALALMGRFASRIAGVARAEGATLLHAHSPVLNGLPTLWVGRRLGIPVVYEARAFWEDAAVDHGTIREGSLRYRLTRALETFLFRRADRVVVIAEAMRQEVIRRGVDPGRIAVVGNGVDVDRFRPVPRNEPLATQLGINGGLVFGFIGSFYHYEGLRFLVAALPQLRERVPGARLMLVGSGEDTAALREATAASKGAILMPGQVPHEQVEDYYSVIDVFVCPRKRMRLTELVTPLKPLEAMAMAKPVLASDVGGLSELIQHGSTGVLFRADDTSSLIEQATHLGSSRQLRVALGQAARAHVERERTWPRVVSRYLEIYGPARP